MLTIELVPRSAWNANLRSLLPPKEWDKIRRSVYAIADHHCEVCGGVGDKHPVECHELWEYDDVNHVQKLVGLQALCPLCHLAKHVGLAEVKGRLQEVARHVISVNKWSKKQFEEHRREAFIQWNKRNQYQWSLDTSWLGSFNNHPITAPNVDP